MKKVKYDFVPRIVGTDQKKVNDTIDAWKLYLDALTTAKGDICCSLDVDEVSDEVLINLLSAGPGKIITLLHRVKGGCPDYMNLEKMIEFGLLNDFYAEFIKADAIEYEKYKRRAEEWFKYDLSLLRDENGCFAITRDFEDQVKNHFTRFTRNEEENEALQQIEQIVEGLNYFIPSKVKISYGLHGINEVLKMIKMSQDRDKFVVNHYCFNQIF